MVAASNLGFPRIGAKRQLKTATERFWSGKSTEEELLAVGKELRLDAWKFQHEVGIDYIPSNDFSFYDHVLDTIAMVGAVPDRFAGISGGDAGVDLKTYFAMARGSKTTVNGQLVDAPAMEMTKWFNTNYHFIVPELRKGQTFEFSSKKCLNEFLEAREAGIETRPVLLGPLTFLHLAKGLDKGAKLELLEPLVKVYRQIIAALKNAGAKWIQMDEPCLSIDLDAQHAAAFRYAYEELAKEETSLLLTTYFAGLGKNLDLALTLPVQGIHLDLVNGVEDLQSALSGLPEQMYLSVGVVDGHNVWRTDLQKVVDALGDVVEKIGPSRLIVAPSCSMLHVPIDADLETAFKPEERALLAFAKQKIKEIAVITDGLFIGLKEIEDVLRENNEFFAQDTHNVARHNPLVESRLKSVSKQMGKRLSHFDKRAAEQQHKLKLPLLPTTTIGSFPQTKEIREARKNFRAGKLSAADYEKAMKSEIANSIAIQERIGVDVLVHGEPERTDMVEYFAPMLEGMLV